MPYVPVTTNEGTTEWYSFPEGADRNAILSAIFADLDRRGIQAQRVGLFQDTLPSGVTTSNPVLGGSTGRTGVDSGAVPPVGGVGDIEPQLPFGAYLEGLRARGEPTTGALGQLARGQFGPAATAFGAGQALGIVPGGETLAGFTTGGGAGRFRDVATQAFGQLGGLAQGALPENDFISSLLSPQFFGAEGTGAFQLPGSAVQGINLARQAAATRLSPFTVAQLGPSNARIRDQIEDAIFRARGGGGGFNFIPFLQQRFGTA